jgi:4-hydroxy-tetrahydrodipicolinate synthase
MRLQGAITALVTPFTSGGDFDPEAAKKVLKQQVEGGIDGVVVAGTTGESPTLSEDEKHRYTELAIEIARGKVPVIVGTGTNATRSTVAATKAAKSWGADAALVVCPYYNKPTQEGLFRHFKAVFEETGMPVVAYNVPGRTACDLLPETIARLVEIGAIAAVKDATANMQRAVETWALVPSGKRFDLLSGDDFTILPFVACGGAGVISVVSNLVPGDTSRLVKESASANWSVARPLNARIIALSKALFSVSSPIPVKAGMSLLGLCADELRLPLVADAGAKATVEKAMRAYGGLLS